MSGIHTEIVGEMTQHLAFKTQQLKIEGKSVMGVQKAGRKEGGGREGGEKKRDLLPTEDKRTRVVSGGVPPTSTPRHTARRVFPDQGLNPCSLPWELGVTTTGPPGKS